MSSGQMASERDDGRGGEGEWRKGEERGKKKRERERDAGRDCIIYNLILKKSYSFTLAIIWLVT